MQYKEALKEEHYNYYNYNQLENIEEAVSCYLNHISKHSNIAVLVDDDVDGFTSAACIYMYTKKIAPEVNIKYILHKTQKHNLNLDNKDVIIPEETNLLIIPDAGSNDIEQCKRLKEKGIDIIILDHHVMENKNEYAVVVNSQDNTYPNKFLSGVGVVYKFMQAIDQYYWCFNADDYLDLVALGIISDNMSVSNIENRIIIDKGLNKIRNKFLLNLIQSQEYSLKGELNGIDVQFYITPLINALIRVGDQEKKDLLFNAFIENYQEFDYKKRRSTTVVKEDIYSRVSRFCKNAKNKQKRLVDKMLPAIIEDIQKNNFDKNTVVFGNLAGIGTHLTGLLAIKIADYFNKPCVLISGTNKSFTGSGRNNNFSNIENLQQTLLKTNCFDYVLGHNNAFGVKIQKENIQKSIEILNENLKDVDMEYCIPVDFSLDENQFEISFIRRMADLKKYYGVNFKQPYILVKNILITHDNTEIIGKNLNTWKIVNDNGIEFVKFNFEDDDALYEKLLECNGDFYINVIGKVGFNNFNGVLTPQMIVEDYELC